MNLFWRSKYKNVIEQIENIVLRNDTIYDYEPCDLCYCYKARMISDGDHICLDCHLEKTNIAGLYFQHLYG